MVLCQHVEQDLLTLTGHLDPPPVFSFAPVVFVGHLLSFFPLVIVLSVLVLRLMASGYPFGIFILFFCVAKIKYVMYNVTDYSILCNDAVSYVIDKGCHFTHMWGKTCMIASFP